MESGNRIRGWKALTQKWDHWRKIVVKAKVHNELWRQSKRKKSTLMTKELEQSVIWN